MPAIRNNLFYHMRVIMIVMALFLTACVDNRSYKQEELKVFNDVMEEILKKRPPSNLLSDEGPPPPPGNDLKDYFESLSHNLIISDTLKSLKRILEQDHWLIEETINDSIILTYKTLEVIENERELKDRIIDVRQIKNIWIYRQFGDTVDKDERPKANINLELSRVAFDSEKKIGMFYCSVLDEGHSGYVTLILVKKTNDKWVMIHGTNYE